MFVNMRCRVFSLYTVRSGLEPHTPEGTNRWFAFRVREEFVVACHLDNQVNGKLTIDGVNTVQYTGVVVYTNLMTMDVKSMAAC